MDHERLPDWIIAGLLVLSLLLPAGLHLLAAFLR
jgi:hypothetical protein